MHFDSTISIGNIISTFVFLGGIMVLYGRLVAIEIKLEAVWDWWKGHIVQGEVGEQGPRGRQGVQGIQGIQGDK